MQKDHNMMVPILEGIQTLNSYGMEVVSGIILGLDTDKPETGDALLEFIDESQIPLLTINLLQALPQTPLWDRLETRRAADRGRGPRFQRRFPAALRRRSSARGANAWGAPTSRRSCLRATSISATTPIPTGSSAGHAGADDLGQHQARPDHAAQHLLEGRRARRLPERVLEVRAAAAARAATSRV